MYNQRPKDDLLIEAKFNVSSNSMEAVNRGIIVNGIVYKATVARDNSEGKLTHVQMTIVRMPNMETFLEDLMRSLKYYGKLYQIKKYTCDGFFEGQVSIMIDTNVRYIDKQGHAYDVLLPSLHWT